MEQRLSNILNISAILLIFGFMLASTASARRIAVSPNSLGACDKNCTQDSDCTGSPICGWAGCGQISGTCAVLVAPQR
jgi:hypothetical protein